MTNLVEIVETLADPTAIHLYDTGDGRLVAYGPDALTIRDELGLPIENVGGKPIFSWPWIDQNPIANRLESVGYRVVVSCREPAEPEDDGEKIQKSLW